VYVQQKINKAVGTKASRDVEMMVTYSSKAVRVIIKVRQRDKGGQGRELNEVEP
jgi:hypothetical protein